MSTTARGKIGREELRQFSPGGKLGFSHFPMDLVVAPSMWVRTLGEVVFEREHESGGHFPAYDRPEKPVRCGGNIREKGRCFWKCQGALRVLVR